MGQQRGQISAYRGQIYFSTSGNLERIADTRLGQRDYQYDSLRRVIEMEDKHRMHTVQKHSSETPDAALKQRAINGAHPTTGEVPVPPRGNLSSQFKNWRVHLQALNKAMTREGLGLNPHTGLDHNSDPIVRLELPGAGRGYRPNRNDQQNPTLNENLNWFEVKFRQDEVNSPYTAFPTERK